MDLQKELLQDIRPYLELRIGKNLLTEPESASGLTLDNHSGNPSAGISIGADLGKYFGVEAALDYDKTSMFQANGTKAGDYSMTRAMAQARLRYPLADGRVVPFALAGVGAGFGEFSGREDFSFNGGGNDLGIIGVIGAGLDYFVVDNIALSVQAKYFTGFDPTIDVDGVERELSADSVDVMAGLRVYADHLAVSQGQPRLVEPARDSNRVRGYLTFKGGRAIFTDTNTVPGVEIETLSGLFGEGGIGMNFNRNWGAEFDVNYTRAQLTSPVLGDITGYPVFTYTLLGRYRYPLWADKLVPYALAGGGIGFGENGDRDQPFSVTQFSADTDASPLAIFGGGIDYFIEDNLSVAIEAKYTTLFETDVAVAGVPAILSPDSVALTAGVRIFYP